MNRKRQSFILRIWFEDEPNLAGYAPALRGSIQPIGAESIRYFSSYARLLEALERLTGWQDGQGLQGSGASQGELP